MTMDRMSWVALEEMADGFDENLQASTNELDGHAYEFELDGGGSLNLDFKGDSVTLGGGDLKGTASYRAFLVQDGLYFVHATIDDLTILSGALDSDASVFVGAIGQLGNKPEPFRVHQTWMRGRLRGTTARLPEMTGEMVGHRVRYRYSSDDVYDHIYLTPNLYTWICMSGAEVGEADTDPCVTYRLRDGVVLFSWLERILGVEGMVLVDHNARRSVGLQFAVDQFSGATINLTMGAHALPVSFTPGLSDADPSGQEHS